MEREIVADRPHSLDWKGAKRRPLNKLGSGKKLREDTRPSKDGPRNIPLKIKEKKKGHKKKQPLKQTRLPSRKAYGTVVCTTGS